MKNFLLLTAGVVALYSCSPKEIDEQIQDKKTELSALKSTFRKDTTKLVAEIDSLKRLKGDSLDVEYTKVKVLELKKNNFTSFFEVHGVVETDQNIQVMPETQGTIKSITVREGQKVKAGQRLGTIDTELLGKQISEVRTSLELANTMFEKQQKLREANVGTEVQYLQAKNQKESLERTLSTLQAQVGQGYITAPISGTIDKIFPKTGEMATPASPFARIVNVESIYISADISESYLGKIKVGDSVSVHVPSLDQQVPAKVSYVGTYINPMNRTFSVHVSVPNSQGALLPNVLTTLTIEKENLKNAITVPSKVVLNDGRNQYAYVVNSKNGEHMVEKRIVKVGPDYDGTVVINEGLKAGDKVIYAGQTTVSDGVLVDIVK